MLLPGRSSRDRIGVREIQVFCYNRQAGDHENLHSNLSKLDVTYSTIGRSKTNVRRGVIDAPKARRSMSGKNQNVGLGCWDRCTAQDD
jgi:hypothetical protein